MELRAVETPRAARRAGVSQLGQPDAPLRGQAAAL